MKKLIYFCFTCFMLFIVFALSMACLHSCTPNEEPTIVLQGTPEQAQMCAEAVIDSIKPDRYAWCYNEMQGSLNLTVDFIYEIQIYYSKGTVVYYAEYICYVINGSVSIDKLSSSRI